MKYTDEKLNEIEETFDVAESWEIAVVASESFRGLLEDLRLARAVLRHIASFAEKHIDQDDVHRCVHAAQVALAPTLTSRVEGK